MCDKVPQIENGRMTCVRVGMGGKKCSPSCSPGHVFYQKFHQRRRPSYLCNAHRVDWKVRRFIPDCSPVHPLGYNDCEAGWEGRDDNTCVACPPGKALILDTFFSGRVGVGLLSPLPAPVY